MAASGEAYKTAYEEIERGTIDKGIWAKCFVDARGDENKAKALYIEKRVKELTADSGRMSDAEHNEIKKVENKTQAAILAFSMTAGAIFGPYLLWEKLRDVSELSSYGTTATGVVTEYDPYQSRRGSTRHKHLIEYDGYTKPFVLDEQVAVGTQYPVMYSTKNPRLAIITQAKKGFWPLVNDQIGWGGLATSLALFIGCGAAALWNVRKLRS